MNTHGPSNQPVLELHKQIHMYLLALEVEQKFCLSIHLGFTTLTTPTH